jgi:GMP synthase-like glutamine amidotransferase
MKFLIFQHARVEHPAIFREFFAADGIEWHAIELDEGEPIPRLDGFDALMAFGGPMDVWQEREHPWLVAEKAAIRSWVRERRNPFLGICLGHQLLADALGGTVKKMDVPEIGVCEVTLSPAGTSSPLFLDLPPVLPVLQWHGAAVERVPDGGVVLASNAHCAIQSFSFANIAYGVQYHMEPTECTIHEWGQIPEYRKSLEQIAGTDGARRLEQQTIERINDFRQSSGILHRNFLRIVENRRSTRNAS